MTGHWSVGVFPGIVLLVAVAAATVLADRLRDILDPRGAYTRIQGTKRMVPVITRRVPGSAVAIFGASVIPFVIVRLLPADPVREGLFEPLRMDLNPVSRRTSDVPPSTHVHG